MTARPLSLRWLAGFRLTNMKPPPARPAPVKPTTVSTASSLRMMSTTCRSFSPSACEEMLWSARRPPLSWPLSCCGKKPLGAALNRYTFSPTTATRISITSALLSRAQSRLLS